MLRVLERVLLELVALLGLLVLVLGLEQEMEMEMLVFALMRDQGSSRVKMR